MTDQDALEAPRAAAAWLQDRRERLERYEQEDTALVWLTTSEIEGILRSFDVLDAAGALTVEQRVLQEDLIELLASGDDGESEIRSDRA
jgi:hypothetical protein